MRTFALMVAMAFVWITTVEGAPPQPPRGLKTVVRNDYFVAPNGTTSNSGRSADAPWPMQYGLDRLGPGVTVVALPGIYSGAFRIYNRSGAPGNPAIIVAQSKWTAVLANSTSVGLDIYNSRHVVVDGLCVTNAARAGIGTYEPHITVRNCWVVNNAMLGMDFSSAGISNSIVENNLIELSGRGAWSGSGPRYHGLYISGPNTIIRNNVVRHNAGWGIHYFTGYAGTRQHNTHIYNNLTYGHRDFYGVTIWGAVDGGSLPGTNYFANNTVLDGVSVYYGTLRATNNIILPAAINPRNPIYSASGTQRPVVTADFNFGTNAISPAGPNDVIRSVDASTLFANAAKGLYWLSSESPARGVAAKIPGPVNFFGRFEPSVTDMGAFQYSAILAGDTRDLDPSTASRNYWSTSVQ